MEPANGKVLSGDLPHTLQQAVKHMSGMSLLKGAGNSNAQSVCTTVPDGWRKLQAECLVQNSMGSHAS